MIGLIVTATVYAIVTFVLYFLGVIAHEATHVAVCLLTRSPVVSVSLTRVDYDPPSEAADAAVRAATVVASVPLLVGYNHWLQQNISAQRLLAGAFVVGYLPKSLDGTDWYGFRRLLTIAHDRVFGAPADADGD